MFMISAQGFEIQQFKKQVHSSSVGRDTSISERPVSVATYKIGAYCLQIQIELRFFTGEPRRQYSVLRSRNLFTDYFEDEVKVASSEPRKKDDHGRLWLRADFAGAAPCCEVFGQR